MYKDDPCIITYDEFLYGIANKTFQDKDGYGIFLTQNLSEVEPFIAEVKCNFKYMLNYHNKYPFVLWNSY